MGLPEGKRYSRTAAGEEIGVALGNKLFVGTFHKTGTVLLASVFRLLSHRLGLGCEPTFLRGTA